MNEDGIDGFRRFADELPLFVWTQDPTGRVTWANRAWHRFIQLPPSIATSLEGWRNVIHPDDIAPVLSAFDTAVAACAPYEHEFRLRPSDGDESTYRWLRFKGIPQHAAAGFTGWLGTAIDVHDARLLASERLVLERAVREASERSEARFRTLAEAIPQILWTADADGSITWYNHGWYDFTGQTAEEAAGWGWQAVHHPEDFPEVMRRWPDAIANGVPFEMEFRLRGRNGMFRWFLTRIRPHRDESGTIIAWFGTNTDITEQKRDIDQTRRVAQTLQEVFLPERLPELEGVAFDATYVPAGSEALVGGDWYDAFRLPNGGLVLSIGDVAGHGLTAAVDAGRLRQVIFSESLDSNDPAAVLVKADRVLRAQSDTFATAIVAFYDPSAQTLTYASAGHPMPIVAEDRRAPRLLQGGGAPLGTGFIEGGLAVTTSSVALENESLLVFYTDGVTEFGRDITGGEAALLRAVARLADRSTAAPASTLLAEITHGQPPSDDVAILTMRRSRSLAEHPPRQLPLTKTWRFHSSHAYSARASRLELIAFVQEHAPKNEDLFTTELILGELLANTVEHAPGLVEINIDWSEDRPIVRIRDTGPGLTTFNPALPKDDLDENGRGLFLVATLATSLTVKPAPGFGTEITVILPPSRGSRPSVGNGNACTAEVG